MSTGHAAKRKKSRLTNKQFAALGILITLGLIFLCTMLICGLVFTIYMTTSIDSKLDIGAETMNLNYTSVVYYIDDDGNEQELEQLFASQNRTWADLSEMPVHLRNAAIAIEDERFESHNGVDWYRTAGAAVNLFFKMRSDFGGSTITQQLVKNLTGDKQATVQRKLQEIMRARYIEKHHSKDEIIELYLNTIYLGQGCYGVRTAAEVYFNKDVSELTLAECASIIGITNLPTYYDPFINPENNKKRQVNILNKMLELKKITKEEYDEATAQELVFTREKRAEQLTSKQSYFVDQVIEDVISDLMEERGYSYQVAEKMIYSGGLKIYATIDPDIQNAMDSVFKNSANFPTYKGSTQPECAMVVMDPYTGNVLGIVGGRGEKTLNRGLNRATNSYRQPGSSIKPLSVYAPAIEYGLINPQSPVDDAPIKVLSNSAYPKNESRTYAGRMTILSGLEDSLNTVAMKTLVDLTPERSFNFLTANLGFSSLNRKSDINLAPLSLGALTKGVSVLEMAAAYSAFPNKGNYTQPKTYTKVLDNQNKVLLEKEAQVIDAMSEKTAAYMNYMLQKVVTQGTGVYAKLKSGMPAAAKTGTTDDDKDRWFVGYTPYYCAAVWYGYDKPKQIPKSLSPALTVWKKVMDEIHTGLENKNFFETDDFKYVNVCSCSGLIPGEACSLDPRGSRIIAGYFHKDDVPKKKCDVHKLVQIDSVTKQLAGEFCPTENLKNVGLLDLQRTFPMSGITLGDEQYTLRSYNADGTPKAPDGGYFFTAAGSPPMNTLCSAHTSAPEPEETEPSDDDLENNPDDTGDSESNGNEASTDSDDSQSSENDQSTDEESGNTGDDSFTSDTQKQNNSQNDNSTAE